MKPNVRVFLVLTVLMASCTTQPEPEVRRADAVKTIDIHSLPPGLIVELNGEYVGTTPLELVVTSSQSGNWTTQYARPFHPIIVRASTPDTTGWEQKVWYPGDRIPSRILFRIPGAMKRLAVN